MLTMSIHNFLLYTSSYIYIYIYLVTVIIIVIHNQNIDECHNLSIWIFYVMISLSSINHAFKG